MFTQAHPRGPVRTAGRLVIAALLPVLVLLVASACDDDLFNVEWAPAPDSVLLYSLARPEINLPSAFNFQERVRIEISRPSATGAWDVALDTRDDQLVLLPPGVLHINSRARVTALQGLEFDDVREAPRDTTVYSADEPVPVEPNTVYVVRTSQRVGQFGRRCVYFAKLEPVDIDVAAGTLRFLYDSNPICNDRRLVPPGQ